MSLIQDAQTALELTSLDLPASPQVLAIDVEVSEDSSGEDSLNVFVVIPDDVHDESLTGDNILHLKRAIRESLQKHGIDLFSYVRLRTVQERSEELAEQTE